MQRLENESVLISGKWMPTTQLRRQLCKGNLQRFHEAAAHGLDNNNTQRFANEVIHCGNSLAHLLLGALSLAHFKWSMSSLWRAPLNMHSRSSFCLAIFFFHGRSWAMLFNTLHVHLTTWVICSGWANATGLCTDTYEVGSEHRLHTPPAPLGHSQHLQSQTYKFGTSWRNTLTLTDW